MERLQEPSRFAEEPFPDREGGEMRGKNTKEYWYYKYLCTGTAQAGSQDRRCNAHQERNRRMVWGSASSPWSEVSPEKTRSSMTRGRQDALLL